MRNTVIDGGSFECQPKKDNSIKITTYGFNMCPLSTIKEHLRYLIPDIITVFYEAIPHTYLSVNLLSITLFQQ